MEMKRAWIALLVGLGLCAGACTSGRVAAAKSPTPSPTSSPLSSPSPSPYPLIFRADIPSKARRVAGGCWSTQAYRGPVPAWLDEATVHNVPIGLPYVVTTSASAAGFIFSYPLRAHWQNKILWVVRTPREGGPLILELHPIASPTPLVKFSRPADSGPGEIYPSGIEVPTAGCWHFTLRWSTGRAELNLRFVAK